MLGVNKHCLTLMRLMSPIWPRDRFVLELPPSMCFRSHGPFTYMIYSIIRMMFMMSQAQHGQVGDVGLWVWVAQVGLTRPVTQETHPRDVSP